MIGLITVSYNQYQLTREFLDSLATVKNAKDLSVYIADVSTKKEIIKIVGMVFLGIVIVLGVISFVKKMLKLFIVLAVILAIVFFATQLNG